MSEELKHSIQHEDLVLLNGAYQDLQVEADAIAAIARFAESKNVNLEEALGMIKTKVGSALDLEDFTKKSEVDEKVQLLGTTLQVYAQSANHFNLCKNLGATDDQFKGFVGFMNELEERLYDKLDVDALAPKLEEVNGNK